MVISAKDVVNESDESFDLLIQVWIRFLIAFYSLLVFFPEAQDFGEAGHVVEKILFSYSLFSTCMLFVYDMQKIRKLASIYVTHWIDVLVFGMLVALTGGAGSIFFPLFFFPILVASFTWGFAEGIRVVTTTAVMFVVIILVLVLLKFPYSLAEAFMRPLFLVLFGYMIAYWGGGRVVLNKRLSLLREISTNWNPRFGVHHSIKVNLARLVEFFDASRCILVLDRQEEEVRYVMYTADRKNPPHEQKTPKTIESATARLLLRIPGTIALSYESATKSGFRALNKLISFDVNTLESSDRYLREGKLLSVMFDDESFISVPYKQQGVASGRLYLIASNRSFNRSDVSFTKQVADVIASVVDNMGLIENLIAEASGQERFRISLDVHDTTIQPYIGLTLALDALAIDFNTDSRLTDRLYEIIKMANLTIADLRSFKDTLREKSFMRGEVLLSSIKSQAERLNRFYGIQVEVSGSVDPNLSGKIAEASFQIVKESLSNILRHTNSRQAIVALSNTDEFLILEICNEVDSASPAPEFMPKSILERVNILGGNLSVESNVHGYTVIRINLPIERE